MRNFDDTSWSVQMTDRSLQNLIDEVPDLVEYFFNDTQALHMRATPSLKGAAVAPEVTNWRDEQRAWRESAILFDQSHHMPALFLDGPDALRLLERVGINSFASFGSDRAKQLVVCSPRGHVIGDCVLYHHGNAGFELTSGMTMLNWVQYQAETGGYDVSIERDAPTAQNPTGRRVKYRLQLEGPNAAQIFADIVDGPVPEIPFFRTAHVTIAGCDVVVLRHGMAGHQGAELSGPFEEIEVVRSAILEAGFRHGLLRGGSKAYFSTLFEEAWMAYPCPGIYTGEELRGFREWLPADGWEGNLQLGGSYYESDIERYYVTPWELGYGKLLKFDHDFIGREALEAMQDEPQRSRRTLVWHVEDVDRVYRSQFGDGPRYKAIEFPVAYYGWPHGDEIRDGDGRLVGVSCHCGYSNNEGAVLSLAMLDQRVATPGTELTITWGEPHGGSRKPHVERHEQTHIRAVVAPAPYARTVQKLKRAPIGGAA